MKKNWSVFQMVVLVVFVALGIYITHQLLRYAGWGWIGFLATIFWITFVFAIALSQPLYFWGNESLSDSIWVERLNVVGYLAFPYVSDLLVMILLRDLIGFAAWGGFLFQWWDWDGYSLYSATWTILSLFLPLLLLGLGYLTVWLGPFVHHVKVRDPRLPQEFEGFRIAHLSDIHMGPMMTDRLIDRMLRKLRREKYDALVMTGDIVDCDPVMYRERLWGLRELEAPEGVYYCTGNHEYYWGFEKVRPVFDGTKIQVLQNETAYLNRGGQQLSFTGLPDPVSRFFPKARAFNWDEISPASDGEYRVLLAHQPYLADEAVHKGFQLQLSGHTHAGQFFPWNFLILFFQKYSKGLYRIKKDKCGKKGLQDLWLYVNQGTGFWGPPTRLGTYGEITILELTRGEDSKPKA